MIMICNVPDEVVKSVKMGTWCGSSVAEKMIANGIPLEQIRAEIKECTEFKGTSPYDWAVRWNDCLDEVLEIIDKAESEITDDIKN